MKKFTLLLTICLTLGLTLQSLAQNKRSDCIRDIAEPIVRKSVFPKSNFQLQPDGRTAIETVELKNGDKLTIRNRGCEYYCLTFNFETTRFQKDTCDLKFWYKVSSELMAEVLKGIDAPVDLKSGIAALDNYSEKDKTNHYRNLKTRHRINFGVREPMEFVTVDRIQKLSDRKFLVILTFVVPL